TGSCRSGARGRGRTGPRTAQAVPDPRRRLSARQRQHVPGQRQLTGALVDPKTLARIGAIAFVAVAITATVIELTRKEERPEAAMPRPAQTGAADPLRDELFRCQSLGEAGPRDPACLRA